MIVVSLIGHIDQAFVKSSLVRPALVTSNQQDRSAQGIECKRHPPHLTLPEKPQLLHVGVARTLERVRRGPAQVWSELGQQPSMRQTAELSVEGVVKQNGSSHAGIMA